MKKIMPVILCLAAVLLLCACQQSATLAALDDYANSILEQVGPVPTVTVPPAPTVKPSYVPKVTASPAPSAAASPSASPAASPSPVPSPSPTGELISAPDFDVFPTLSVSPRVSPSPSATAKVETSVKPSSVQTAAASQAAGSVASPAPTYAAAEAPIPQSVPFQVTTPKPAEAYAPAVQAPTQAQAAEQSAPEAAPQNVQAEAEAAPEPAPAEVYAPAEAVSASGVTGSDIAAYAQQFVGYNYSWGGKSPDTGFDCSGLVYYVYGQFGYTLNRIAADMASNGVHVDAENIAPGDVICFYNQGSYIGHVGIYVGGGNYVHAQDSATGVVVSPLSERTCKIEIRRILE